MERLCRKLQALAEPTRVRIVALLDGRQELCVCEIVEALRLPQYQVSRHLRTLRRAGLVSVRRQGRWMHYCISPRLGAGDRAVVQALCSRARSEATTRADLHRLEQCLRPRRGTAICPPTSHGSEGM